MRKIIKDNKTAADATSLAKPESSCWSRLIRSTIASIAEFNSSIINTKKIGTISKTLSIDDSPSQ